MPLAERDSYRTDPNRRRPLIRGLRWMFYPRVFLTVWDNGGKAKRGQYGDRGWVGGSLRIFRILEDAGVTFEITGMDNITKPEGPVVFIGNHMSTLETFVLPCIIQPVRPVTFIVKDSLINMPVFGPVMRSRDPVVVGRKNPREDLKAVLEGGLERLRRGISVIVFPQSTRSLDFVPSEFNSLGVKLALRAGVPIVPIALKTDAWGVGRLIKDFGPLDPKKKAHFAFGTPLTVAGRGVEEHEAVIRFIGERLADWKREEAKGGL